jgi:hypothetical protein
VQLPWIIYADMVATAAPLAAAGIHRRRLTAARRCMLWWSAFLVAANTVTVLLGMRNMNNHWLNYLITPVGAGLALWALSLWQTSPLATLCFRLLIPLLGVTWIAIVLLLENTRTFSLLAEPFAGLLVLGGAIYTLVSRASREPGNMFQQDWLWVGGGLALYSGVAIALPPTAHWLLVSHPELVVKAYEVKSLLEIVAFLLIARGMFCPTPASPFGGFSSRASSRSWWSSSDSSSRW